MRVLHLSPHPDDELLGTPAVLIALADAGHEVVNLAVSLGRPEQAERRERELRDACARAGFTLHVCTPPLRIGRDDDRSAAQSQLTDALVRGGAAGFELVVAPSPQDGHHGHELVGRAAATAAAALRIPLWTWGLWSELPVPTILYPFGPELLDRIEHALAAHAGELARNDYRRLLRTRAQINAITGPERVFGFGSPGLEEPYAELLCELVPRAPVMLLGTSRRLDPSSPLKPPTTDDVSGWVHAQSLRAQLGR
jgi:LmbE family N-acetylglucosaminyl deacetylase